MKPVNVTIDNNDEEIGTIQCFTFSNTTELYNTLRSDVRTGERILDMLNMTIVMDSLEWGREELKNKGQGVPNNPFVAYDTLKKARKKKDDHHESGVWE